MFKVTRSFWIDSAKLINPTEVGSFSSAIPETRMIRSAKLGVRRNQ